MRGDNRITNIFNSNSSECTASCRWVLFLIIKFWLIFFEKISLFIQQQKGLRIVWKCDMKNVNWKTNASLFFFYFFYLFFRYLNCCLRREELKIIHRCETHSIFRCEIVRLNEMLKWKFHRSMWNPSHFEFHASFKTETLPIFSQLSHTA